MNLPYTALHFPVYESMKKAVTADQREEEGLVVQVIMCFFPRSLVAECGTSHLEYMLVFNRARR